MSDIHDAFAAYKALQTALRELGPRQVLDDLYRFYPQVYVELETEIERRIRVKKLGTLLAGSM